MTVISIEHASTDYEAVSEKLQRVRGQTWGGYADLPSRVSRQSTPQEVRILIRTQQISTQNVSERGVVEANSIAKALFLALAESSEVSISTVVRDSLESLRRTASAFASLSVAKEELIQRSLKAFTCDSEGLAMAGIQRLLNRSNDSEWTDKKNDRRCELIDKDIEGTLRPFESRELELLQRQMLAYRRKKAPLPLKEAQILHQELLKKAGELDK